MSETYSGEPDVLQGVPKSLSLETIGINQEPVSNDELSPVNHRPNKLIAFIAAASTIGALITGQTMESPAHAAATTKQVEILMPNTGKWGSTGSGQANEHTISGHGQHAEDLFMVAGSEVMLSASAPNGGTIAFDLLTTWDSCQGDAGKGIRLAVKLDNEKVGEVEFAHLDEMVTSGSFTNGMVLGKTKKWEYKKGCWEVTTDAGVHAHYEATSDSGNYACYYDRTVGSLVSSGTPISRLGKTSATDAKVACTETPGGGGGTAPPNVSDGTFLKVTDSNAIYRVVGGAPIRIYNQGIIPGFDGGQVVPISHAQLGQMPTYPKDEGDIISLVEAGGAKYRFVGGAPVRIYNCAPLNNCAGAIDVNFQSLVEHDHMRQRPKEGAVISIAEAGGSGIYEFVGGAPIRQYNWGAIPNFGEAIPVNHQSLATLDHMNAVPADGAAVSIVEAGGAALFRFVGGAPIRLYNWGAIPDMPQVVSINHQSLIEYDHMNTRPANGSVINIAEAGGSGIYEFAGGAPMRLYNWGPIPNMRPAIGVNYQSLTELDHMNTYPKNGEFIASLETGVVYRVAGGAALRLYNHGGIPGFNGAVLVNQQTIDSLDHLLASPSNGTVLRGVSSGTYWQINNGERTQVGSNNNAVIVDEQTISAFPIDQ